MVFGTDRKNRYLAKEKGKNDPSNLMYVVSRSSIRLQRRVVKHTVKNRELAIQQRLIDHTEN